MLWNLLANAVKFMPSGGRIDVTAREGSSDLEITVKDSGPGIDRSFLPHVFEPFRRAESISTRTVGGLGLGLAIVRHIVEAHGGTVTADSDGPGSGSVFVVRIPTSRASVGDIPAVALTAFTDPKSVHDAFAAGFDAHLGKPLEPHVLADALTKVLRVRRSA